jgi:hypothetical protein
MELTIRLQPPRSSHNHFPPQWILIVPRLRPAVWDDIVRGAPVTALHTLQRTTGASDDDDEEEESDNDENASTGVTAGDLLEFDDNFPISPAQEEQDDQLAPSQASSQVLPRDIVETCDDNDNRDEDA